MRHEQAEGDGEQARRFAEAVRRIRAESLARRERRPAAPWGSRCGLVAVVFVAALAAAGKRPAERQRAAETALQTGAAPLPGSGSGPPTNDALVDGMIAIRPAVRACYQRYRVPGVVAVKLEIRPNGRVASPQVSGRLAGTATARCIERAVRSASFRPREGSPSSARSASVDWRLGEATSIVSLL